jgi:hypothetical protein
VNRFALAIVLSLAPSLAFPQHQGTSSSSSSSSGGSSGSYHGGSSGYSGGGGGSSPSSGSSSGSSGYSGGSRGYSGGAHSSAPSSSSPSGNYSGGVASGSHSTTNSSSSSAGRSAISSLQDSSSHSSIRVGVSGFETPGVGAGNAAGRDTSSHSNPGVGTTGWQLNRGTPDNSGAGELSTPGSAGLGRPESIQDPTWLHQPIRLVLPPQDLDKHTRQEIFAERARAMGLEPNQSSFHRTTEAMGDREFRHVSWIAKIFGKKAQSPDSATPPTKSELRVCHGKECRAGSIPPKPCAGGNCPKPPSTSTEAICASGFRGTSGSCQPWGYLENCSYPYTVHSLGHCRVRWASVDFGYCWQILRELERRKTLLDRVKQAQTMACSADPHDGECMRLTQDVNRGLRQIQQLQQQYRMCAAAAGLHLPADARAWPFHSWPSVVWP